MNYLLDTCLLSELRKPEPDAGVVAWVSDVDKARLFVSVLSRGDSKRSRQAGVEDGRRKNAL